MRAFFYYIYNICGTLLYMKYHELIHKCYQGITWNALLYGVNKISYLAVSFLLYTKLSSHYFAAWANLLGMTYLFLLWSDMGLRKSLPRYLPQFSQSREEFYSFIRFVVLIQSGILTAFAALFYILLPQLSRLINIHHTQPLIYLGVILFLVEGIVVLLRLIFHAHFWHKKFNFIATLINTVEFICTLGCIFFLPPTMTLVKYIITVKILTSLAIAITSVINLPSLAKAFEQHQTTINQPSKKEFLIHSACMWTSLTVKSLSERNFMLPLFTYFLGPEIANMYKIANDGALFFQRAIYKTIDTTDTSLIMHSSHNQQMLRKAINHLQHKIIILCLTLMAIFTIALPYMHSIYPYQQNPLITLPFSVLTLGYLTEALLSPYERLIEVKRNYHYLLLAYSGYLLAMTVIITTPIISIIGLIPSIMIVIAARILGSTIAGLMAYKRYIKTNKTTTKAFIALSSVINNPKNAL